MKYIFWIIFCVSIMSCVKSDSSQVDTEIVQVDSIVTTSLIDNGAELSVVGSTILDFEEIVQGEKVTLDFKIKNTGTGDLRIWDIETGCGCTAAVWPKNKNIKQGEIEVIKIKFNSEGRIGKYNKTISLSSNANPIVLTITGNILKN